MIPFFTFGQRKFTDVRQLIMKLYTPDDMNITTEEIFIEREFTWHIICAANSNNSETQVIRLCRLSKTRA